MVVKSQVVTYTLSVALLLLCHDAFACGCGVPAAAVGMRPTPVDLQAEANQEAAELVRPWRLGATYGQSEASVRFGKHEQSQLSRKAALLSVSRLIAPGLQIGGVIGVTFGGGVEEGSGRHDMSPGVIGAIRTRVTFIEGRGWKPFLEGAVALTASTAETKDKQSGAKGRWTALDLRASSTLGWNISDIWFPYASLRVFGGPVFWDVNDELRVGSDQHHFQIGLGSGLSIPYGPELFVDWSLPIGEWGLSAGVGYSF